MKSRYPNNDYKDKSVGLLKKTQNIIRTVFSALSTIFFKPVALLVTLSRWFKSRNNDTIQEITQSKNKSQETKTKEGKFMAKEQKIKDNNKRKEVGILDDTSHNHVFHYSLNEMMPYQTKFKNQPIKVSDIKTEEQVEKNNIKINDLNEEIKKIKEHMSKQDMEIAALKKQFEKQFAENAMWIATLTKRQGLSQNEENVKCPPPRPDNYKLFKSCP
jgi:hypothetical protein